MGFEIAIRCLTVLLFISCTASSSGLKNKIERELQLEERYHVKWEVDFATKIITFTTTVTGLGYVGLGISPSNNMAGADIVIGGVLNGVPYFKDYFSPENGIDPIEDASQDWTLIFATEDNGITTMKFWRILATCDDDDNEITEDTQYLIWAIGRSDVVTGHGSGNMGAATINLLDPTPDVVDFSGFEQVNLTYSYPMPSHHTMYWCTIHKMPQAFNGTENHIVAFDIILDTAASQQHVHHVVVIRCTPPAGIPSEDYFEQYVGHFGDDCYKENPLIPTHDCTSLVYIWSVGGGPLVLPSNVGYSMGETGAAEYVMLEVHYDNPDEVSGVTVDTGVSIYYTPEKREVNGAVMMVGYFVGHPQTIPPDMEEFVSVVHCGPQCTDTVLPTNGVEVFNVLLHSHLAGRKMKVRHFRDREELPWITKDDHYDFNYQASRPLRESVKYLPGDHITVECTYDTRGRSGVTLGGRPSFDEMCTAFLWMYPLQESIICQSLMMPLDPLLNMFGIQELNWDGGMDADPLVARPLEFVNRTYSSVLNEGDWSDERKRQVQEITRFGPQMQECAWPSPPSVVNYPEIDSVYVPEDTCENRDSSGTLIEGYKFLLWLCFAIWACTI